MTEDPEAPEPPSEPSPPSLEDQVYALAQPSAPPAGPWPTAEGPTVGPPPSRRRRAVVAAGLVVALVVVLAAGTLTFVGSGPDYPDEWDPRVAELVTFVEDERDLEFKHPVDVDFLEEADFTKEVTADEGDLTEEDKADIEQSTAQLRALGLVQGDVDLFKEQNELTGEGVLAFYEFDRERIVVRGTTLDVETKATVVHELTHVLQDQHFDIGDRQEEPMPDGASLALRALVEGDADRIEDAWVDDLSDKQRKEYERALEGQQETAEDIDVPDVLKAFFAAPYQLGAGLTYLLDEAEGSDGIDRALRAPPDSDEALLDPWTFVADHDIADNPPVPAVEEGEEAVERADDEATDFGALSWYLVLASRIDAHQALEAVDGWAGDSYVAYRRGKTECIRGTFRGDDAGDAGEMERALRAWAAATPALGAKVSRVGEDVTVASCDPGTDADLPEPRAATDALLLPVARAQIAVQAMREGAAKRVARCFGARVVEEFPADRLNAPTATPAEQQLVQTLVQECLREG